MDACVEAEKLKAEGARLFEDRKWEEAIARYTEALHRLHISGTADGDPDGEEVARSGGVLEAEKKGEDDGEHNPADEEIEKKRKEIARACHLNCAICHVKKGGKESLAEGVSAATSALELSGERTEAKALYWRGRSLLGLGRLGDARRDLRRAAKMEPGNKPVRKDLAACAAKIKAREAARRKKRAGFLNGSAGPSIYEEKDDLAHIKFKNAKRSQEEKEAEKKKKNGKKKEKKTSSESAFNPGDANDYSKWDCLTDSSDEEEEEKEAVVRPPAPAPKPSPKQKKKPQVEDDDSDDGIDEANLGDAKGYVKRADGTKTTFFHRDIGNKEKELIGDITPKAISTPAHQVTATAGDTAGSKWNRAGTFEERDRSEWCKDALKRLLSGTSIEWGDKDADDLADGATTGASGVRVTKVRDVEGDAAVCVISGSRRHIFDLSFVLEWEAREGGATASRGALRYADVDGPAVTDGKYEVAVEYRKSVAANRKAVLSPLLEVDGEGLRAAVASRLDAFVAEFKVSC